MFTVAPSFPMLASIRAVYSLLKTGQTQQVIFFLSGRDSNMLMYIRLKAEYNI